MISPSPQPLPGYEHIHRYWDRELNNYVVKILPGEYYITQHDELLSTVLGSCVSACIHDRINGIGGMNHFMLPMRLLAEENDWKNSPISAVTRYGNYAMEHVINEILKYGGKRQHLEVKLFGGSQILKQTINIGQQNIEFVKRYLSIEKLPLIAEDLGGHYPRKILYYPATGLVRLKKLGSVNRILLERETALHQKLQSSPESGDVDLF